METYRQRVGRSVAYANREFKDNISAALSSEFAFDYIAAVVAYPFELVKAYRNHPWRA